jgi:hypothetical protein
MLRVRLQVASIAIAFSLAVVPSFNVLAQSPYSEAEAIAWAEEIKQKTEFARRFDNAMSLFNHLKKEAKGGTTHTWATIPDWSGLWTRDYRPGRTVLDALQDHDDEAQLTPDYLEEWKKRQANARAGKLFDPLSACLPTGFPRVLTAPFMREQIVTPKQTWLITEQVNEIRRVYTDGRDHIAELDRYPLWLGDSIGFWDGPRLVIHTNQLRSGIFARNAPRHSEQVEVVEIWERVSAGRHIDVDVWIFDPMALRAPWYVKVRYVEQPNDDFFLRIRHWECAENPNNEVIEDESGASVYRELNFEDTERTDSGQSQ